LSRGSLTVNRDLDGAGLRSAALRSIDVTSARHENDKTCVIAAIHWHAIQLRASHHTAHRGFLCLHQRGGCGDFDALRNIAEFEPERHVKGGTQLQQEPVSALALETLGSHGDVVETRCEWVNPVVPKLVSLALPRNARCCVPHLDFCPRHRCAGGIRDQAHKLTTPSLGKRGSGENEHQQ
jgi:hypothetical protein